MVQESEKYKSEDEKVRKTVEAKNALENYLYSVKNTLKDEKYKDKITGDDRTAVENKV